jgi:uncharacterized protein (DUF58 family)
VQAVVRTTNEKGRQESRRRPLTLTRGGAAYLGATAFVFAATASSGANLLYLLFGLLVGIFVVSLLVSSWSLGGIEIRRGFGDHIIAGEPADVEYRLTNTKRYWPTMALHFREASAELSACPVGFVLHLASGAASTRVATRMTAKRRGIVRLAEIELSTTFPFGLLRCRRRVRVSQEVAVYPRIGMLNRRLALGYRESIESGAITSNRRGGHDDFYGIREYRPGDNVRAIHWRSTARTGEVMIREMCANAPPQLIVVLNLRSWREVSGGREAAERAIELAAALVCYGFFENFAVGLAVAGVRETGSVSASGAGGSVLPVPGMGREARARALRTLAVMAVEDVEAGAGIDIPERIAGHSEWVVVTLRGGDEVGDLFPAGSRRVAGRGTGSGHRTVLALDAPDAGTWVQFLSAADTLRILRARDLIKPEP